MSRTIARQRIVNRFVAAGATSPAGAIAFDAGDAHTARVFRRMRAHGVLAEATLGRYWLCPQRLGRFRGALRRRVAAWIATSGIAATVAATALAFAE